MLRLLIVGIIVLSDTTYCQNIILPTSQSQNVAVSNFTSVFISIPIVPSQNDTIPIHPFHNSSLPVGMTITDIFDDVRNNAIKDELQELSKQLEILKKSRYIFDIWDLFQTEYNKTYNSTEEKNKRFNIFIDNFKMIVDENAKLRNLSYGFQLQVTKFADLTSEEFLEKWTGLKIDDKNAKPPGEYVDDESDTNGSGSSTDAHKYKKKKNGSRHRRTTRRPRRYRSSKVTRRHHTTTRRPYKIPRKPSKTTRPPRLRKSVDYRGYMNAIEHQGGCASCYAFAVAAAVEGTYVLKKRRRFRLSKQELVDCSQNNGCINGDIGVTFDYIRKRNGLYTATSYPYTGVQHNCIVKSVKKGAIKGYGVTPPHDEEEMKRAVAKYGPLVVAVDASVEVRYYDHVKRSGGSDIIDSPTCSKQVNHAVVIVGYGTQNGQDYWLVRNSWGSNWGLDGHFKIARNKNMCGIATTGYYTIV